MSSKDSTDTQRIKTASSSIRDAKIQDSNNPLLTGAVQQLRGPNGTDASSGQTAPPPPRRDGPMHDVRFMQADTPCGQGHPHKFGCGGKSPPALAVLPHPRAHDLPRSAVSSGRHPCKDRPPRHGHVARQNNTINPAVQTAPTRNSGPRWFGVSRSIPGGEVAGPGPRPLQALLLVQTQQQQPEARNKTAKMSA